MYYLLTERFKEQEAKLVEIIQGACSPVKIFLLGSSLLSRRTERCSCRMHPPAAMWVIIMCWLLLRAARKLIPYRIRLKTGVRILFQQPLSF